MKDRYQPPPSAREGVRYQAPPSAADQAPKLTENERIRSEILGGGPDAVAYYDTLTEDRAALVEQAAYYKREAERLTAENERLRAEYRQLGTDYETAVSHGSDGRSRAHAAESRLATARVAIKSYHCELVDTREHVKTLTTENERLRAELATKAGYDTWMRTAKALGRELDEATESEKRYHEAAQEWEHLCRAAESRLAEANAENERLRKSEAEWKYWRSTAVKACDRAEARLATAVAAAAKALTLLARAQDGSPKTPREANAHSVQLDYDIGQLLQSEGWVWDAINRRWTEAETGSATWTEYRGRQP